MKKQMLVSVFILFALTSMAQASPIEKADILHVIESDPVGAAALKMASGKECRSEITKMPATSFNAFEALLTCDDSDSDSETGGVYLQIIIDGIYYGEGAGEVQKVRLFRAG